MLDTEPKVEVEVPSTLDISEQLLPAIKNWGVGERFLIKLEVESVSTSKGSMYNSNDKEEIRSSFRVLGAEAIEINDNKPDNNKEAFIRELLKSAKDME